MSVSPFQMTPGGAHAAVAPTGARERSARDRYGHATPIHGDVCTIQRRLRPGAPSGRASAQRAAQDASARGLERAQETEHAPSQSKMKNSTESTSLSTSDFCSLLAAAIRRRAPRRGRAPQPRRHALGASSSATAASAAGGVVVQYGRRSRRTLGHRDCGRGGARSWRGSCAGAQRGLRRGAQLVARSRSDRRAAGAAAHSRVRSSHTALSELHSLHRSLGAGAGQASRRRCPVQLDSIAVAPAGMALAAVLCAPSAAARAATRAGRCRARCPARSTCRAVQ